MTQLFENNRQLITDLIELMPRDVHQFGDQLMSDQTIGEPIVYLRKTIEEFVVNEVILKYHEMKSNDNYFETKGNYNYEEMSDKCEAVLDKMWETINCLDFSRVCVHFRHCFAFISLLKAFIKIYSIMASKESKDIEFCLNQRLIALKALDFGLLMSNKLNENNILAKFAKTIHKSVMDCKPLSGNQNEDNLLVLDSDLSKGFDEMIPYFHNCIDYRIKRETDLDFISFNEMYFKPKIPVILTDCMNDWPAMNERKWSVDYIESVAAFRTVPIEVGINYTDEEWTQKLMTVKEFINEFITDCRCDRIGYLAQHNLFDQIEELMADFSVPDLCSQTDEDCVDVDINAWFGPKGTTSPLHYDPNDNLLAQVFGHKYIRLYSSETPHEAIYPYNCRLLFNTSEVNVEKVDSIKFPNFNQIDNYFECVLKEGEMLYIPKRYWHFVKSLSTSFSISFWWK